MRLPASAVLLAGRVLRQPHLPSPRGLDNLGERLLDANRTIGQPNKITVIFGRRISKHYRGKLQTEIEDMDLPNPVIRSHYGNGFIKQYVRDHLILRTEAALSLQERRGGAGTLGCDCGCQRRSEIASASRSKIASRRGLRVVDWDSRHGRARTQAYLFKSEISDILHFGSIDWRPGRQRYDQ